MVIRIKFEIAHSENLEPLLANYFIVSECHLSLNHEITSSENPKGIKVTVSRSDKQKCPRCWMYASDHEDELCSRCQTVLKNSNR